MTTRAYTIPPPDKTFEVEYHGETRSEIVVGVKANTAHYAICKAFPKLHPSDPRISCREIPTAESVQERQEAETVRPPPDDGNPYPGLHIPVSDCQCSDCTCATIRDFLARETRIRDMGIRVASRLRREVLENVLFCFIDSAPEWAFELLYTSDDLAGDQ